MQFWDPKTSVPAERNYRIRLEGANGADPENELAQGAVITRTGEGAYLITWRSNPGVFVGWSWAFGAATPADMKGYTAVRDTYDTTSDVFTLAFVVYDSSFNAADVIVNQWADLCVTFKETTA